MHSAPIRVIIMSYLEHLPLQFTTSVLLILLFGWPLLSSAEQDSTSSNDFSSVEERRLHVRIIEEQDSLIEDQKSLVLEEIRLEKLRDEIDAKLAEIDRKLAELETRKQDLEQLLSQKEKKDQQRLISLGKIYENMDPFVAAEAVAALDRQVAADILAAMKPRSAAKILDVLNREEAAEISRFFLALPEQ